MKIVLLLIVAFNFMSGIRETSSSYNKEDVLCSAVIEYITNNSPGSDILTAEISGCSSSSFNRLNLTSGTANSLIQTTCAYKTVRMKIAGVFASVKMYDANGNLLETQDYVGPENIFYTFSTPGCAMVHYIID